MWPLLAHSKQLTYRWGFPERVGGEVDSEPEFEDLSGFTEAFAGQRFVPDLEELRPITLLVVKQEFLLEVVELRGTVQVRRTTLQLNPLALALFL